MGNSKIRVVIVDDENRIRRGISKIIASCGDEWEIVGEFNNGKLLLEAYKENSLTIDLLVTDVKMPVMDGLTLIKELKKLTSFEAIVISGFDDFAYLQSALREGAFDYLLKPIDRDELKEQLERVKRKIEREASIEEETIVKQQYSIQNQFFLEHIWNKQSNTSEQQWIEKGFTNEKYTLVQVNIDANTLWNQSISLDDVQSLLDHKLIEYQMRYWYCVEGGALWLLLGMNNELKQYPDGYEVLLNMKHQYKESFKQTITIAISDSFMHLSKISEKKKQLLFTFFNRKINSRDQILYEKERKSEWLLKETKQQLNQLMNEIFGAMDAIDKKDKVKIFMEQFFNLLEHGASYLELNEYVQSLYKRIKYIYMKEDMNQLDAPILQEDIMFGNHFSLIKKEIFQWLDTVLENLKEIYHAKKMDPIKKAKDWIMDHIHENVTIERIAKEVYLNPTYFCELFKLQCGETVLDYITKARVKKAKELLLQTDLKIYEVAQKVGYSDTKYFSKLFKRYDGSLPSKYKER